MMLVMIVYKHSKYRNRLGYLCGRLEDDKGTACCLVRFPDDYLLYAFSREDTIISETEVINPLHLSIG